MNRFIKIIAVLLPLISSCVKDVVPPPEIITFSPLHSSVWVAGDSIVVQAEVSSPIDIDYIEMSLLNSAQISVNPSKTVYPSGSSYSLNTYYPLSNFNLETGQYYFLLEAANADATERVYVNIMISGIPKRSTALIAYGYETGSTTHIYKIDSLLQGQLFKELNGDFAGGDVNSEKQILYCIGKNTGSFHSIDASNAEIINEIPAIINPPFPYFTSVSYSNSLLLTGYYDGYINGYYGNGNLKFSYLVNQFRPENLKYDGTFILGTFNYQSGNVPAFGMIYEVSGLVKDMVFTSFSTVDFFRISSDLLILFVNNNSSSEIYTLNTTNMATHKISSLPAGNIYSVAQCSVYKFAISHDNGLLIYDYNSNTVENFSLGAKTGILCFDDVDERLYLSSGKEIFSYTWPGAVQYGPLIMPDSIRDMHILYNR